MSGQGHDYEKDVPYYHKTHIEPTFNSPSLWKLYHPPRFIKMLTINCINNAETYFLKNKINPYDKFDYGIFLFEELNRY